MERKPSLFWPLTLISAGVIWLMVSAGILPSENLWALTHFWPFILIGAGVGLILRPYWKYSTLVMDVLIVGGGVFSILFAPQLGWAKPTMFMFHDGDVYFGPGESGSGEVTMQTREVGDFHAIEISYPGEVVITQGNAVSVKIEAEDNVLPGLKTEVRGGTLEIFYKAEKGRHVNPTEPVKITIVVKELDDVQFSSAGELTIDGLKTDELEFGLSGAGRVIVSDIETQSLTVDLSGAGSMNASGTADSLDLNISGFGSFDGEDLHSQTASVNISGAGSATVWVDDELDANVSGAGSVNYYGSPASLTKNVSGVGGVNSKGEK
ncbi:MAG: DUF2807 domain-containing protein [Chloroflexi bacterium]|nr:DUF2807 domain-containing protein [Chloroflexota bacterium]